MEAVGALEHETRIRLVLFLLASRATAGATMGDNVNPQLVAAMSLIEQLRAENAKLVSMWEQATP